jgi:anti-sigma factor RsiW
MRRFSHRVRFRRDHLWAPRRMSAYLDGELAGRRGTRMERHLDECKECRRLIGGLRLVLRGLSALPEPEGSRGSQIAAAVRVRLDPPGAP